jgi:hypothetical protein
VDRTDGDASLGTHLDPATRAVDHAGGDASPVLGTAIRAVQG